MKSLNGFLNQERKPSTPARKIRCDKKHDVKIPVDERLAEVIRYKARMRGESITHYCTAIIEKTLQRNHYYEEIEYETSSDMVHVSLSNESYSEVVYRAAKWKCSIREATHRIFHWGVKLHENL